MFLHLVKVCLWWFEKMLPLGFYISQWFANYIPQPLDYALKHVLRVSHVVRYLDNITMADNSKKKLHAAVRYVGRFLRKRGMKLKDDWQVFRFEYERRDGSATGRAVSSMGWVFHRNRTTLRKRNIMHLSRVAGKLRHKRERKERFPIGTCRSYTSLMGWVRHADVYDWYLKWVKPCVNYRTVKAIISRKEEASRYERMEKGAVLHAA